MGYEGKGEEWTIEKMTTIADHDTQLVKEVDAGVKNQIWMVGKNNRFWEMLDWTLGF